MTALYVLAETKLGMKEERGANVAITFGRLLEPCSVCFTPLNQLQFEPLVQPGQQTAPNLYVPVCADLQLDGRPAFFIDPDTAAPRLRKALFYLVRLKLGVAGHVKGYCVAPPAAFTPSVS